MGESDTNKNVAVAGLACILFFAAVVDAGYGSSKAIQAVCSSTDYKETCQKTLANANTSNPKDLIKYAIDATVNNVGGVLKSTDLFKKAEKDPSVQAALDVCNQVLETAVDDLKRSIDKIGEFQPTKVKQYVEDLKTWLSAVITNQETCIDAFENTTSDTGAKMKELMKSARELASNGLAMSTDISSLLSQLKIPDFGNWRLLEEKSGEDERRQLAARGKGKSPAPNAVVAQDGSGQFKTIQAAVDTVPKKNTSPFIIYIKAGTYKEYVEIPKKVNQVIFIGDGPLKTRITGSKSFAGGVKTFRTCTVSVNGDLFMAKDIGIENTAGPEGHQAVALRVSGDKAIFWNVHIDGYQDTLYAHSYRQYYSNCTISGTIDFIFGDSLAIFQNCKFIIRKPMKSQGCMLTAQGRVDPRSIGAIIIQNGDITAEPAFLSAQPKFEAYLGRPWKELSRTIIMQSNIGGFIDPTGWSPWQGTFALDTCYYAEFQNRGPGSDTSKRVTWKGYKKINEKTAQTFTGGVAFGGDEWVKYAGVPYVPTMMKV